jgi:ABC-2 type transport system permease protein
VSNATGPIADLSYRSYEGTLDAPTQRWKVIAKQQIMRTVQHKWFWRCVIGASWYYLVMIIVLAFVDSMVQGTGQDTTRALERLGALDWTAQFLNGYSFGQLWCLFIAVVAGAGAIANDNRANALLVYLSKPCTKKDYIIGKWVGVFVPVLFAMLAPALFFYMFGAMNYRGYGFISDDPWLLLRVIAMTTFGAAFHASLVLGVSSFFNQGRIATATYVGIYFISNIVTVFLGIIISEAHDAPAAMRSLAEALYYCSIDGVNIGIAKVFLDIDSAQIFMGADSGVNIDRPTPLLALGGMVLVSALMLRLVWRKVRAVEVVG